MDFLVRIILHKGNLFSIKITFYPYNASVAAIILALKS
jgi:hypothetical protein